MTINSPEFYLYLFAIVLVYFSVPPKMQWGVLLFSSVLFYFYVSNWVGSFLVITTLATYFAGITLQKQEDRLADFLKTAPPLEEKKAAREKTGRRKNLTLWAYLSINFGILVLIKYSGVFDVVVSQVQKFAGMPEAAILLPLGISFYTFQAASYVLDVSRGRISAETNLPKLALFVSYFPQLTVGPISRYQHLAPQLLQQHRFDVTRFKFGVQLILWGLIKKMVIADRMDVFVDSVFSNYAQYKGFTIYFGALFYMIQVFADFSGAIDIVRGVSKIFGINMVNNFHQPFFAKSISDFWRRWHITLGGWFKEYVFYPLALTKPFGQMGKVARKVLPHHYAKVFPAVIAMLITFTLIGIWHGPNWTFVVYGLYNGFFIILGILFGGKFEGEKALGLKTKDWPFKTLQILFTLFLGGIGRYFFRSPSLDVSYAMIAQTLRTLDPRQFIDGSLFKTDLGQKEFIVLAVMVIIMMVVEVAHARGFKVRAWIAARPLLLRWSIYLGAVLILVIFGIYGDEYNPTDFIYRTF